jgi:NAD(P)-dependent dehydrogenase (short-subunit alcohol dehydrogenase family)
MSDSARRVVLVTGAGSGLGHVCALHLAARGFDVYGSTLTSEEAAYLEREAANRDVTVRTIVMDVTERASVELAADRIRVECGRLDALVQFAGMGLRGFFEDLALDEIRRVYEVNVFGTMTVAQVMLPLLRAARGRMIVTTSIAGRVGSMSISGYASSKFAVEGFIECLAQEMAPFGVSISLLEPGLVFTEHFTRNRNRAARASDPASPYYAWFCQHEKIVDDLLRRNRFTPQHIAQVVERILQARNPRLRYVVGIKAKAVLALRRYIPGEIFERCYFGLVRRMVTSPRHQAPGLSSAGEALTERR